MGTLRVMRLSLDDPVLVGRIASDGAMFTYDSSYLENPEATPLSLSLPLSGEAYSEKRFRPYFEGLLAEGTARRVLAGELQLPEEDYLALLAACGKDCVGDVVIECEDDEEQKGESGYEPVSLEELRSVFHDVPRIAEANIAARLSLAGAQSKIGLAHDSRMPIGDGWLHAHGRCATTHILKASHVRDVPELEFLCMQAASACGIAVARTALLDLGTPVLAVERFDRRVSDAGALLRVERLHQEDLAQAFGIVSGSKYAELPGGSVSSIARLIRVRSVRPAYDIAEFAKTMLFAYLVGDCDRHLKNISIFPHRSRRNGDTLLSLAPAYDLVCTTRFPNLSRDLAMGLGGVRSIDDVAPEALCAFAREIGLAPSALQALARPLAEHAASAISAAGRGEYGPVPESTPYVADDLVDDLQPRLEVLKRFCL